MSTSMTCPRCGRQWQLAETVWREIPCPQCGALTPPPPAPPPILLNREEMEEAAAGGIAMRPKEPKEELVDLTPMVDIVFFLLVFFLVTSLQAVQASIRVPPPDPQEKTSTSVADFQDDEEFVIVRIDQDDTIWLEDAAIPSQQELIIRLRDLAEGGATRGILVLGHEEASHGMMIQVLDAGAEAGLKDIRMGEDSGADQ